MPDRDDDDFAAFVAGRQRSLQQLAWLLTGDWAGAVRTRTTCSRVVC